MAVLDLASPEAIFTLTPLVESKSATPSRTVSMCGVGPVPPNVTGLEPCAEQATASNRLKPTPKNERVTVRVIMKSPCTTFPPVPRIAILGTQQQQSYRPYRTRWYRAWRGGNLRRWPARHQLARDAPSHGVRPLLRSPAPATLR